MHYDQASEKVQWFERMSDAISLEHMRDQKSPSTHVSSSCCIRPPRKYFRLGCNVGIVKSTI